MAKYIITAAAPKRLGDHQNTGVGTEIELSQGFGEAFVSMHWLIDPEAEARTKAAAGAAQAETDAKAAAEAEAQAQAEEAARVEAARVAAEQAAKGAEENAKAEAEAASGGASSDDATENPENMVTGGVKDTACGEGSQKPKGRPAAKK